MQQESRLSSQVTVQVFFGLNGLPVSEFSVLGVTGRCLRHEAAWSVRDRSRLRVKEAVFNTLLTPLSGIR